MDFIDPEQPHYHEKFPEDRSEVLYEFGDDPTIYIKVDDASDSHRSIGIG
jgi:hypothetical protein